MAPSRRSGAATAKLAIYDNPAPYTIDETVIDRERARLVWSALDALREQERVVVYLRYFLTSPSGAGRVPRLRARHRQVPAAPLARKLSDVVVNQYPQLSRDSL